MRILVAEDDRVSAKVLLRSLERLGHSVTVAYDGADAWAQVLAHHFPVIISDWMMPGVDGLELCRRVRSFQDRGYTFFVVLTSKGNKSDRLEAMVAGADDFLSKPLEKAELHARLVVADRILAMQGRLETQKRELDTQKASLVNTNLQLKQRQDELGTALRSLEATSRIAEVSRNRFSQLFEGLPVACFTYDLEGQVFEWNRKSEDMFGTPAHAALGGKVADLIGADIVGESGSESLSKILDGASFEDQDWNNGNRYLLVSGLPLRGPEGRITGGIIAAVDVTRQRLADEQIANQLIELNDAHLALAQLNDRLSALATTDALTGIPNHRAFQDRLSQTIAEASRGRTFSLAMVDVDHFKLFNDEFGHQAGDEVLARVAQTLKSNVRKTDFVARYGGEEFCVIFSGVGEPKAVELCEMLRTAIEAIDCRYRLVTASFGVATYSADSRSAESLLRAADEALYDAKQSGRNCVRSNSQRKFPAA